MRVKIIKDVPGYHTGTSYSVSTDTAMHLVSEGLAECDNGVSKEPLLAWIGAKPITGKIENPEPPSEPKKQRMRGRKKK